MRICRPKNFGVRALVKKPTALMGWGFQTPETTEPGSTSSYYTRNHTPSRMPQDLQPTVSQLNYLVL